jgi:cyclase
MTLENAVQHYGLDLLSDGVYAAIARDGGSAISNSGLVDLGDSTLVIDTFLTPTAAEDLRRDAQRLTGQSPRWVVDTHYHNDHIWGNQAFLPEADIISTAETRDLIRTAGKEEYDEYRAITDERLKDFQARQAAAETDAQRAAFEMWIGYFGSLKRDFPRLRVTLPNLVFEKRMNLYGSRRWAELVAFSGAHTGSDTVVYLPDDGILFMSDLLFVGFHPYLGDGSPERWLEVLRSILDGTAGIQNARVFVPGHGPTGSLADLQRLVDYIQACQGIAQALAAEGKVSPEDVASTPIPDAYRNWTMPRFFYANLRFLLDNLK